MRSIFVMNVCVLERKTARARAAEIWFCGCAVLCQAPSSSGGRRSGSVSVLALLVLLAFLTRAGLLLPFNIFRCSSDQPTRSSAQTSPRSKARLITSAKGRSSEDFDRALRTFIANERPTNDFSEVTTICACDLAPKHSQAALQLLLIYNLWKIKALQCGRSRQPRSLHPSSLTFRDEGLIQDEHPFS